MADVVKMDLTRSLSLLNGRNDGERAGSRLISSRGLTPWTKSTTSTRSKNPGADMKSGCLPSGICKKNRSVVLPNSSLCRRILPPRTNTVVAVISSTVSPDFVLTWMRTVGKLGFRRLGISVSTESSSLTSAPAMSLPDVRRLLSWERTPLRSARRLCRWLPALVRRLLPSFPVRFSSLLLPFPFPLFRFDSSLHCFHLSG